MAPIPFGRRKAAKTVRNLAIAEAVLALAKGGRRSSKRVSGKLLVIGGGAVAAVGAAALLGRKKVASRGGDADAPSPPPQPSNYDAPGPVANTATPIPAPDPHGEPPARIDPAAEEAAAAAEAGAIGGEPAGYAGAAPDEAASEELRPLAEGGEGESEGLEQAEADLAGNATDSDPSPSAAERQIDEAIDQAGQPQAGETPEPAVELATPVDETSPEVPGGGISGRPRAGLDEDEPATETPGAPPTGSPEPEEGSEPAATETPATPPTQEDDDDGAEWRTWSGNAVKP
jgi:hypothetical protein